MGQSGDGEAFTVDQLKRVPFSPVRETIIRTLGTAYPGQVKMEQLVTAVYGGARRPRQVRCGLRVQIVTLRTLLRPLGWTISHSKPGMSADQGYGLAPLTH